MTILAFPRRLFPFTDESTFHKGMDYLTQGEIVLAGRVSRAWERAANSPVIWKKISERAGVPLVKSEKNEPRNRKEDFKILYPITISGKMIGQLFGQVIGEIPPISETCFRKLNEIDPFADITLLGKRVESKIGRYFGVLLGGGIRMRETFRLVVMPSRVERTVPAEFPLELDEMENLVPRPAGLVPAEEQGANLRRMVIPFTWHNLKQLSEHPLQGANYAPIFDLRDAPAVSVESDSCAPKNRVYLMREPMVEEKNLFYFSDLESRVQTKGFELAPLRVRALFYAVKALQGYLQPIHQVDLRFYGGAQSGSISFKKPRQVLQINLENLQVYIQQMNADFMADYFNTKVAGSPGIDATAPKS